MRDAIAQYLEDVLSYAELAREDERSVHGELAEHLHELTQSFPNSNPREIYAMLKDRFGNPKRVGRAIAAAKGRVRTYFKKLRRKLPMQIGIALILALAVRYEVAEAFYVAGDGVAPVIPKGNRVLVYKLAHSFVSGDVVVYKISNGEFRLGTIQKQNAGGDCLIERNSGRAKEVQDVQRQDIIGRVFLNTH